MLARPPHMVSRWLLRNAEHKLSFMSLLLEGCRKAGSVGQHGAGKCLPVGQSLKTTRPLAQNCISVWTAWSFRSVQAITNSCQKVGNQFLGLLLNLLLMMRQGCLGDALEAFRFCR